MSNSRPYIVDDYSESQSRRSNHSSNVMRPKYVRSHPNQPLSASVCDANQPLPASYSYRKQSASVPHAYHHSASILPNRSAPHQSQDVRTMSYPPVPRQFSQFDDYSDDYGDDHCEDYYDPYFDEDPPEHVHPNPNPGPSHVFSIYFLVIFGFFFRV